MSLVAFKARNHPQQEVQDDVDDRRAPVEFFAELHAVHCFTVDAAANARNAHLPRYWSLSEDALRQSWACERVWCNPPYSNLAAWVEKAWIEMVDGSAAIIVMLLPANRCEQPFWQQHIEPYRDADPLHGVRLSTRFLANRMRFGWPESRPRPLKGDRPPFGCVLLTWSRVESAESATPELGVLHRENWRGR